ncbi:MAG: hypothetical protein DLM73_16600 [Chthoniobacterales bacterium]|nr:MAG: hypothetical protein DLM73_16600 [Chthoniobacterales bacterium]
MIALSCSIVSITLPAQGVASQTREEMSCCVKESQHGPKHDDRAPLGKTQDRQCCQACALALALFLTPKAPWLFPSGHGETFSIASADLSSRLDQPPVPPPRA